VFRLRAPRARRSTLQQGLARALGLLLDAVHVDTDQTAVSLDGPAGDEHGIHVAAVHPQDDGADRVTGSLAAEIAVHDASPRGGAVIVTMNRGATSGGPSTKQAGSITPFTARMKRAVRGAIVRRRQQGCQEPGRRLRGTPAPYRIPALAAHRIVTREGAMLDRRRFLRLAGLTALAAAAPRIGEPTEHAACCT